MKVDTTLSNHCLPRCWVYVLSLALGFQAGADSVYPKAVPLRYFGTSQGKSTSCASEAQITALEHAFANRGYPVKLSLFYRHAKVWQNLNRSSDTSLPLNYSAADNAILDSAGSLIPDYMWPEDGEGYDPQQVDPIRPTVSEQALIDPAFPTAESLGFQTTYRTFAPGYLNSSGVAQLRAEVAAGNAVTLSMHGDLLAPLTSIFDDQTGLAIYSTAEQASVLNEHPAHAVAVVGFDDALQAFLIRNSWNGPDEIENRSKMNVTTEELKDLKKMRLKISPRNLPGYYALPYAYVNDLAARGQSGYEVLTLNFSAYGDAYLKFRAKYSIINAPFGCDDRVTRLRAGKFWVDRRIVNRDRKKDTSSFLEEMQGLIVNEAARDENGIFSYAKLAVNRDLPRDLVSEFYAGSFAKYYCGRAAISRGSKVQWPGGDFNSLRKRDPRFDQIIKLISVEANSPLGWSRWFNLIADYMDKGDFKL